jgi:penicillin-binding protein A
MTRRSRLSIHLLFALCVLAIVACAGATLYKVVHVADELERKVYVEQSAVADFEAALDAGSIQVDGAALVFDDAQLDEQLPSRRRQSLVRALAAEASVDGERIRIDTTPISVRNPRLQGSHSPVPRGRILDRRLRIVADSPPVPGRDCRGRIYPYRDATFPVTGSAVAVARKQGLERELDAFLRGDLTDLPARQRALGLAPVQAGDDVVLTIDAELQQAIYRALDGRQGAVVLIDVNSGELLSYVSAPSWDPNVWDFDLETRRPWLNTFDPEAWEAAGYDRDLNPMLDRAGGESKPPGSTAKAVTACAWLGEGHAADESAKCVGRSRDTRLRCHIHRLDTDRHEMALLPAIAESCNTFFGLAGQQLGPALGHTASAFGFNARFDLLVGVPGASWQTAPSFAFAAAQPDGSYTLHDDRWYRANRYLVAQGAIGQNVVEATPLQMAVVAAVIANGGRAVDPHLVKELRTGRDPAEPADHGTGYLHVVSTPGARVIPAGDAAVVQRGMELVMIDGTGRKLVTEQTPDGLAAARNSQGRLIPIAGKTGTAEVANDEPHSWFIGYAPADDPRIAVAVLVENAGAGAEAAAPLGIAVLAEGMVVVDPTYHADATPDLLTPDPTDSVALIAAQADDADTSIVDASR